MTTRNALLAAALLVLLTGCGPTLQTITIHPQKVRTFVVSASNQATFSCPPFGCPPPKSGSGIGGIVPGQVTVGFQAVYDPGTLPCNCWEWTSNAARAGGPVQQSEAAEAVRHGDPRPCADEHQAHRGERGPGR